MAEIINLNRVRKRKARETAEREAEQNRARFGRTVEQKRRDAEAEAESRHKLDLLKREPPPDEGDGRK